MDEYLESLADLHERLDEGLSWSGHERNCAYLNPGGTPGENGGFANISAVSGLDFDDDARGLALFDWDRDGDLDLALANRTAPRLRLMRNATPDSAGYLSFELQGDGATTNRDAIGARVMVDTDRGVLARSLRAGDGFLSQSSKSIHVGLGDRVLAGSVRVRWPGGVEESFRVVTPGHFRLVQGSGRSADVPERSLGVPLETGVQRTDPATTGERVVLPTRLPAPTLSLEPFDGSGAVEIDLAAGATLVNFWASWCVPCRKELEDFADDADVLDEAGITIAALSTDGLGDEPTTSAADAVEFMDGIAFPFPHGLATAETLDKVEIIKRSLFDRRFPLSLPFSLLVDRESNVVALYRGGLETRDLVSDLDTILEAEPRSRRDMSVPFPGRWFTEPRERAPIAGYARWFEDAYPEESVALLGRAVAQASDRLRAATEAFETNAARHELYEAYKGLARIESRLDRHPAAAEHYRAALDLEPEDQRARTALLESLREAGDRAGLKSQLETWLRTDPDSVDLRMRLGEALVAEGDLAGGASEVARAVELEPANPDLRFLYGRTLARQRRMPAALAQFERAVELDPGDADAHFFIGVVASEMGDRNKALRHLERALALDPTSLDAHMESGRILDASGRTDDAIAHYTAVLAADPEHAAAHNDLGVSLVRTGRRAEGIEHIRRAYSMDDRYLATGNSVAWVLATHPDERQRDGEQAVQLAEEINTRTGNRDLAILETLAAAHAENGAFDRAVATVQHALSLSSADDQARERELLGARLELYRSQRPFRGPLQR